MYNRTWSDTVEQAVYTIPEYCAVEKTSRSTVYAEWARGEGVEFFRRGNKILISHEARVRHREKLERKARRRGSPVTPKWSPRSGQENGAQRLRRWPLEGEFKTATSAQ